MAGVTSPWVPAEPLDDAAFASVRRRAIFDCHKWDPQVDDVCTIGSSIPDETNVGGFAG